MRKLHLAFAAAVGLIPIAIAAAQTRDDMEGCRAIEDDARRLACYDAIPPATALPSRGKYEVVALDELKGFALSFRGRFVETDGRIVPGEDFFFLGLDAEDPRPMPLDVELLSRSRLESFRELCGEGCEARVQGRVAPVNFTTGIVADTLTVR